MIIYTSYYCHKVKSALNYSYNDKIHYSGNYLNTLQKFSLKLNKHLGNSEKKILIIFELNMNGYCLKKWTYTDTRLWIIIVLKSGRSNFNCLPRYITSLVAILFITWFDDIDSAIFFLFLCFKLNVHQFFFPISLDRTALQYFRLVQELESLTLVNITLVNMETVCLCMS